MAETVRLLAAEGALHDADAVAGGGSGGLREKVRVALSAAALALAALAIGAPLVSALTATLFTTSTFASG